MINEKLINRDAITVDISSDYTITQGGAYVTIPFNESVKTGKKLTLNNSGGVVIGNGISKVRISSKICLPSNGLTAGAKNLVVQKNGTTVDRVWEYLNKYNSNMTTSSRIIEVSTGDILTLAYYGTKDDKIAGGSMFNCLTVEAVEYN